uniref:uncharacterized protein LOC120325978 isoform X1 n=2 Tax=Styela clava TaxID=7725 RepID=UPI00193ADF6C|nr:uncharacterized protein LOC120325978 isoform X1 [Styela clava]
MDFGRRPVDDSLRITVENNDYYRRTHTSPSRDRFRHEEELRRREHHFSPMHDHHRQSYRRDREDHIRDAWPAVQHDRREFDKRSPRQSPSRYSSWRRNSRDRSPPRVQSPIPPHVSSRSPALPPGVPTKGRNLFYRSRSRSSSPRRRKSRSRSLSRGRSRYRSSRSPRRHSPPHHSGRRSSSYGSRKRFKHRSSSSSSSSSRSHSRSLSKSNTNRDFNPLHLKAEDNSEEENSNNAGYLHPVLNRGPKEEKRSYPLVASQPTATVVTNSSTNIASLAALSQAYGNSPPKQSYTQQDIDDEDRFLYGESLGYTAEEVKAIKPPVPTAVQEKKPEPVQVPNEPKIPTKMTPGGFDSNALKNVLKAIGFNFEMSAQQSQTAQSTHVPDLTTPTPDPQPIKPVQHRIEKPQQIQTIQGGQVARPRLAPQPVQTAQQYYQPYDPYNQAASIPYAPAVAPTIQPSINTSLGYPIHVQGPLNPDGSVLVYQPVSSVAQSPQALYQPHQQIVPPQTSGRVVLPPHRPDTPAKKTDDARQERLKYLKLELEKLKKQQNELLRKKRREKDGHKDPLIKKNNLLQAGVEEQIKEIRQAAEKAAGIASATESSEDEATQEDKEDKYDYFDPGNHLCKICDTVSADLAEFLTHLHSKSHRKSIDPYDRPWNDDDQPKKKKADDCVTKALKGSEFLIPVTGYFCTLCQTFSGDQICAEEHCKSYLHNTIYKKHCKKHHSYEKKFKKKKKAVIQAMENGNKNMKEKNINTQVKYVDKPAKAKDEQKHVLKESKPILKESKYSDRVERVLKYIENDGTAQDKGDKASHKKEKKHKDVKREHSQHRYEEPERQHHRDSERRSYDRSSFGDGDKEKPKSYRQEEKDEKRHYREDRKDERKLPRKYSDEFRERSADHTRPRKNRWSPGYDEYDRQQDDRYEVRHDKRRVETRRSHRSRSRSHENKWVEKSPQIIPKKEENENNSKPVVTSSSSKIPTPGFGKFSWGSGSKAETVKQFDQVPVDNPVLPNEAHDHNRNGDLAGKGKIAIKITGKSQIYPPRLSVPTSVSKSDSIFQPESDKAIQDKKTAELQKKVEALKRENALRNHLSSITLPAGRSARQFQPKPNTAAVILGTRAISKTNNLPFGRNKDSAVIKDNTNEFIPVPPVTAPLFVPARFTRSMAKKDEPFPPSGCKFKPMIPREPTHEPPPPGMAEPLPPGEDVITMGDADDGANSDASGISMEIASDED